MNQRFESFAEGDRMDCFDRAPAAEEAQPIGEILEQLLAQYAARFPEARVCVVELPVAAA